MPDLQGRKVLITRPRDQADALAQAVRAAKGVPVVFPGLEICGRAEDEILADTALLPPADMHLFVSPNAVRYGLRPDLPGLIGAIGPGTANAIREAGQRVDIVPSGGYNSEHLLNTPELKAIAGKNVRIVRGQSGRELLGSTLAHRGARVDYLQVYSRQAPAYTLEQVQALLGEIEAGDFCAWTIMSAETLDNILEILGEAGLRLLSRLPLVTPASRVIIEAEERLRGILAVEADGVSADALIDAIDGVLIRTNEGTVHERRKD